MICWFENHSNEARRNQMDVFFLSGRYASGGPIVSYGFRDAIGLFVARSVIHPNWQSSSDPYFKPNVGGE